MDILGLSRDYTTFDFVCEMSNGSSSRSIGEVVAKYINISGALIIRGLNFASPTEFRSFVAEMSCLGAPTEYGAERASPRTQLGTGVYTATDYDRRADIQLHNECASRSSWPLYLSFYCAQPAEKGGETTVCSIRGVQDRCSPDFLGAFGAQDLLYTRNYGAGCSFSLDFAFGTDDQDRINEYCHRNKIKPQWLWPGRLRTFFRSPAFHRHPISRERLFFNYWAFYNGVLEDERSRLIKNSSFRDNLPFRATFADGSAVPSAIEWEYKQVLCDLTVKVGWQRGDLLILDNMIVAHGRKSFVGDRVVWLVMSGLHAT